MSNRLRIVQGTYNRLLGWSLATNSITQGNMERRARFSGAYNRILLNGRERHPYSCTFTMVGVGITTNHGGTMELLTGRGTSRSAAVRDFVQQAWKARLAKTLRINPTPVL